MFVKYTSFILLLLGSTVVITDTDDLLQNKALIRQFVEIGNSRQLDHLVDVVADDFVRHCQATPQLSVRSREDFRAFMEQDAATFPDSKVTLHQLIAEGDRVAVWATYNGTQDGQMGPFPPTGKLMNLDFGAIFRIEKGKIAELWVTWDNVAGMTQLGLFPPPEPAGS